jgi:hypothetical protein
MDEQLNREMNGMDQVEKMNDEFSENEHAKHGEDDDDDNDDDDEEEQSKSAQQHTSKSQVITNQKVIKKESGENHARDVGHKNQVS